MQVLLGVTLENCLVGTGHVGHDDLACLGLACSGLTSDNDRLVFLVSDQRLERILSHHEEMWAWVLSLLLACIAKASHLRAVVSDLLCEGDVEDGQALVRVDADQDWRTDLRKGVPLLLEALFDVVKDGILAEIVQMQQVFLALHIIVLHCVDFSFSDTFNYMLICDLVQAMFPSIYYLVKLIYH